MVTDIMKHHVQSRKSDVDLHLI